MTAARTLVLATLLAASLGRVPAAADVVAAPAFAGPARDARLGVAFATLTELVETPALLRRPSVARVVATDLDALAAETANRPARDALARVRADLTATAFPPSADVDRDLAVYEQRALAALGKPRAGPFLVGALAEQVRYNALVLREPQADVSGRQLLAGLLGADRLVPGTASARAALGAATPGDWPTIVRLATGLVATILGSPADVPFSDGGPGVWVVLLRSRTLPADALAVRHGAPHFALDVVRFDGTHASYAAYPGGGDDFGRDAPALPCLADREPPGATLRALAVVPPAGTTETQLAASIRALCAAAAAKPSPYVADDASDDRLVINVLVASGVDVRSLLGQLRP